MDKLQERPVKMRNIIAYGVGDLFGGGAFLIIGMLYMFFLTEVAGLTPGRAAAVVSIGKIWDAVSDPLMGWISDHTKSRFGRRRVYFLAGVIPIMLSFVLLWVPLTGASSGMVFAWYAAAYILFSTVFTMVMVPFAALNADMTSDYKTRSRLSASRLIFSGVASLLGGTVPAMVVARYPENPGMGYLIMSIFFAVIFGLPFIVTFLGTWENEREPEEPTEGKRHIFRNFFAILRNRSFRYHILIYVFAYTSMDILMALFAYFLTYYIKKPGAYPIAMGSLLVTQIIMMPAYTALGNRKGKGFAFIIGMVIWLMGMALSLTLSADSSIIHLALVCVIIGLGTSGAVLMPWAILPSVIDVDEILSGTKRSGIYSGAMTLIRKFVYGLIAAPVIGLVLETIGFVSNAEQSAATLQGLRLFFFIGPMILIVLGVLAASRFRITPESHRILTDEIERLKSGGRPEDAAGDARRTCEQLTGRPYNELGLVTKEIQE